MELTTAQAFNLFKSKLELSQNFQDEVTTHHSAIREWIESYDSTIETKLIGSLQRKTRIQPLSDDIFDIDILIILGSFYNWIPSGGIKPENALEKVEDIVSKHGMYEKIGIEQDNPTITFEYEDGVKVELVPAYIDRIGKASDGTLTQPVGRGYWIPKNNKWVIADYDYDAEYITAANKSSDGYLIPTIKMLKSLKRNRFSSITSYHLEALAASIIPNVIEYFKSQKWEISYQYLIYMFFWICKDEVLKTIRLPNSKSPFADGYMTLIKKQELSNLFGKIAEYCKSIVNDTNSVEAWSKLFGQPFPTRA